MRALLVDDSRAIRSVLARILGGLGYETSEAGNGQEALERIRQQGAFDVALVDINMPVMNGIDFVTSGKAERENAGMRIVMVSSETAGTIISRALLAGADEYVMKPFTRDVIVQKVEMNGIPVEVS